MSTDAGVFEYLVLPAQAASQNFSEYTAGGGVVSGTSIVTRYREVRIDPATLVVDSSDARFATTNADGGIISNDGGWTLTGPLDWGTAQNCDQSDNPGAADITLTGTPFVLAAAESFVPQGAVLQTVLLSPSRQTLDLNVSGACASVGPTAAHRVQLALGCANGYLAPDCASTCLPAYAPTGAGTCVPATSLAISAAEPAGSNCAYGGTVHQTGLDLNGDGTLEQGEVNPSQTLYVCNFPPGYTVGGTVTGLPAGLPPDAGQPLVLNLGGESLSLSADGPFHFNTQFFTDAGYSVDLTLLPASRFCEPAQGTSLSGNIDGAPVTSLDLRCYQSGQVTTWAGGSPGLTNGLGTSAQFRSPSGVAIDRSGNTYVADLYNNAIRKITPTGVVSTVGTGSLEQPFDVAVDRSGYIYATDVKHRVVKFNPSGAFSTLAGSGTAGYADGTGAAAQFNNPTAIAVDSLGNVYVADSGNSLLRKITPGGVVTTLVSSGGFAPNPGSPALGAFTDIAVDKDDRVFVSITNKPILMTNASGQIALVAATAQGAGGGVTPGFEKVIGLAVDPSGNLFVADNSGNYRIREITPAGVFAQTNAPPPSTAAVFTLLASGAPGFADGVGSAAQFSGPNALAADALGNLYVADLGNNRIRKVYQTLQGSSVSITSTTVAPATIPTSDYSQLESTFDADPTAVFLLNLLQGSWDAATYGAIPRDGVVFDFAQQMCNLVPGCSSPGDAMSNALTLMQGDSTYYAIVAAWAQLAASPGWGLSVCVPGQPCTPFVSQVPNGEQAALWKSATAPANLINTASLLAGMLGQLQSGDPGYGTTLVSALNNLGDLNNPISRGLDCVLLLADAENIANLQGNGQPLSAAQQAFAAVLVQQLLADNQAALAAVKANFTAFELANEPPSLMGTLYLGMPPSQDLQDALATLIPQTSGNQMTDDTATTTARLLAAIGQSQSAQTGTYIDVTGATAAGLGLGVPLASAITAIGIGSISFAAVSGTFYVTGGVTAVLGLSDAVVAAGGTGATIVALSGPVAIVVAALVAIGEGAAIVAQVDQFNNVMNLFQITMDIQARASLNLAQLKAGPLALFLCTPAQEQYAVINLLGHP